MMKNEKIINTKTEPLNYTNSCNIKLKPLNHPKAKN